MRCAGVDPRELVMTSGSWGIFGLMATIIIRNVRNEHQQPARLLACLTRATRRPVSRQARYAARSRAPESQDGQAGGLRSAQQGGDEEDTPQGHPIQHRARQWLISMNGRARQCVGSQRQMARSMCCLVHLSSRGCVAGRQKVTYVANEGFELLATNVVPGTAEAHHLERRQ